MSKAALAPIAVLLAAIALAGVLGMGHRAGAGSGLATVDLNGGITSQDLANELVGAGLTISNVVYTGHNHAAGTFNGGSGIIGFESGVILGTGDIADVVGPNGAPGTSTNNGTAGDSDLAALTSFSTFDAAVLEFDFVPVSNQVEFQYVFASEEYNEWVGSTFNDVFAFFINGANCATVGGNPVSINTINSSTPALYRDNTGGGINTEMDGLTVVLTCAASVNADQTNHIKLAIADASDANFDSNVFLQTASFVALPTDTPPATETDTPTATATDTAVPTATDTPVPTTTDTPEPTATSTPQPSATDTPVATATGTATATATDTPAPAATPTASLGAAATDTSTPEPTPTPTDTPKPTATATAEESADDATPNVPAAGNPPASLAGGDAAATAGSLPSAGGGPLPGPESALLGLAMLLCATYALATWRYLMSR